MNDPRFRAYLAGEKLYGDDFDEAAIAAWYEDERGAYARLPRTPAYGYGALNVLHGYRHLPRFARFERVLGMGSAGGDEFAPIASRIGGLTIVEPAPPFSRGQVHGVPCRYVEPDPLGRLGFPDASFDLVTCFGVLHHIPNVSAVFREMARVLRPGGWMLVREPVVSMGDWRKPRPGLTPRERGIPPGYLERLAREARLVVVRRSPCLFAGLPAPGNSAFLARLDAFLCRLFEWNTRYHRIGPLEKLGPTSLFLLLRFPRAK